MAKIMGILALAPSPVVAQNNSNEASNQQLLDENYTVTGTVFNQDQEIVPNLEIILQNEEGKILQNTFTNEHGQYSFQNLNTSINEITIPSQLTIQPTYPNPATNKSNLVVGLHQQDNLTITKYNILGQLITTQTFQQLQPGTHHFQIDTQGLASGTYLTTISNGQTLKTQKNTVINQSVVSQNSPQISYQGRTPTPITPNTTTLLDAQNLIITIPESDNYQSFNTSFPLLGNEHINITLEDKLEETIVSGTVKNQRQEPVSNVSIDTPYGQTITTESGTYELTINHPTRLNSLILSTNASEHQPTSQEISLEDQVLNISKDRDLINNNFSITLYNIHGEPIQTPLVLTYLNEAGNGEDSITINPDINGNAQVIFSNWRDENFTLSHNDSNYLKTILGRTPGQKAYERNVFQNDSPDLPVIVPQNQINQTPLTQIYLIPSVGTQQINDLERTVDMDWLLDETVTATGPTGSTSWHTDNLNIAILGFSQDDPSFEVPQEKIDEMLHHTNDIKASYTLENGEKIQNYTLNLIPTPEDPRWQEILETTSENTIRIYRAPTPIPSNSKQYQQINEDWYLRSARSFFNNSASQVAIIEEIFEAFSASDEPSNNARYYINISSQGTSPYFNNIGSTLLRAITMSDPQTRYLPQNQTSQNEQEVKYTITD